MNDLIQELGLISCADRKISTLSGGERRRTSIGIELVADPSILFLDEPTSGLDSFAAKQVLGLLQRVAQAGNTVLFTIHQPSSDVFRSFDRLILLHKGQMMYQGMTKTVTMDFERLGYRYGRNSECRCTLQCCCQSLILNLLQLSTIYAYSIPDNYNPADWILDVAQGDSMEMLESHGFFPTEHSQDFSQYQDYNRASMKQTVHKVSCCIELEMLLHREMISLIRNPTPMIANVLITAFLSVVFGIIFLGVGKDDRSNMLVVQAVVGALVNTLMAVMMGQSQNALMIFSGERPLFMREYSTNHYTIGPYFFSKLVSEALQSCVAMMVQALITYFMIRFQMNFFIFFVILFAMAMTSTAVCVLLGACFCRPKDSSSTLSSCCGSSILLFRSIHCHQFNSSWYSVDSMVVFPQVCSRSCLYLRIGRLRIRACRRQLQCPFTAKQCFSRRQVVVLVGLAGNLLRLSTCGTLGVTKKGLRLFVKENEHVYVAVRVSKYSEEAFGCSSLSSAVSLALRSSTRSSSYGIVVGHVLFHKNGTLIVRILDSDIRTRRFPS